MYHLTRLCFQDCCLEEIAPSGPQCTVRLGRRHRQFTESVNIWSWSTLPGIFYFTCRRVISFACCEQLVKRSGKNLLSWHWSTWLKTTLKNNSAYETRIGLVVSDVVFLSASFGSTSIAHIHRSLRHAPTMPLRILQDKSWRNLGTGLSGAAFSSLIDTPRGFVISLSRRCDENNGRLRACFAKRRLQRRHYLRIVVDLQQEVVPSN